MKCEEIFRNFSDFTPEGVLASINNLPKLRMRDEET